MTVANRERLALAAVALLVVAAYFLAPVFLPTALHAYADVAVLAVGYLLAAVAVQLGSARQPARARSAWRAVQLSLVLMGAGLVWQGIGRAQGNLPQPISPGDGLRLLGYLASLAALWRWAQLGGHGRSIDQLIDGGILAVALLTLSWVVVIVPTIDRLGGHDPLYATISAIFPVLSLGLVSALGMALLTGRRLSVSLQVMALGSAAIFVADLLGFWGRVTGDTPSHLLAGLRLAFGLLSGASAMVEYRFDQQHSTQGPLMSPTRLVSVVVLGLVPAGLYALDLGQRSSMQRGRGLGLAMLALFVLALARVAATMTTASTLSSNLEGMARSDHLTSLPNRRTADEELKRAIARARSSGEALAVVLIDIDHFKRFNDEFGHGVGDELLVGSATAWQSCLGQGQMLARYGGEEFLLIVTDLPVAAVVELTERMRRVTPRQQNFSAGAAMWDRRETGAMLVSRADAALYEAKQNGRARTQIAYALSPVPGAGEQA